jgi:hypothetical protein
MRNEVFIDDMDIYAVFGVLFLKGTQNNLLQPPKRKASLTNNWREYNGEETDLTEARYESKDVSVPCALIADNEADYWRKYQGFFDLVMSDGIHSLFIRELSKEFDFYYKETQNFTQITKIRYTNKVAAKFNLKITLPDPSIDFDQYIVTEGIEDYFITEDSNHILIME